MQPAGAERAEQAGVTLHCQTVAGHAAQRILERATSGGFDLIVLGHRGHSNPWHRLPAAPPIAWSTSTLRRAACWSSIRRRRRQEIIEAAWSVWLLLRAAQILTARVFALLLPGVTNGLKAVVNSRARA
jgi:universal stress protein family protein